MDVVLMDLQTTGNRDNVDIAEDIEERWGLTVGETAEVNVFLPAGN